MFFSHSVVRPGGAWWRRLCPCEACLSCGPTSLRSGIALEGEGGGQERWRRRLEGDHVTGPMPHVHTVPLRTPSSSPRPQRPGDSICGTARYVCLAVQCGAPPSTADAVSTALGGCEAPPCPSAQRWPKWTRPTGLPMESGMSVTHRLRGRGDGWAGGSGVSWQHPQGTQSAQDLATPPDDFHLRRPIWGCPKKSLWPPFFLVCSSIAPTVIGLGRRHRVPEVFESGTVTVTLPVTGYTSCRTLKITRGGHFCRVLQSAAAFWGFACKFSVVFADGRSFFEWPHHAPYHRHRAGFLYRAILQEGGLGGVLRKAAESNLIFPEPIFGPRNRFWVGRCKDGGPPLLLIYEAWYTLLPDHTSCFKFLFPGVSAVLCSVPSLHLYLAEFCGISQGFAGFALRKCGNVGLQMCRPPPSMCDDVIHQTTLKLRFSSNGLPRPGTCSVWPTAVCLRGRRT